MDKKNGQKKWTKKMVKDEQIGKEVVAGLVSFQEMGSSGRASTSTAFCQVYW